MRVLCLFHRVPFPPDKGEKLRGHHLLTHLSRRFTLELAAFFDEGDRAAAEDFVSAHAERALLVPLRHERAVVRSAGALARGRALSCGYFGDRRIARFVAEARARGVEAAYAFSGPMAQYLLDPTGRAELPFVLDLVDVDSAKWDTYARRARPPMRYLYAWEARRLAAFEHRAAAAARRVTLVSAEEADLFRRRNPGLPAGRIAVLENGVDTGYFSPVARRPDSPPAVIFTGRMDYPPNVEGVCWFAEEVWPLLAADHPRLRLLIVGAEPTAAVRRLARDPRILVTGRVVDVRPFYAEADIAIAPLLSARGVQNKVLEALAMERPVVATPAAFAGLDPGAGDYVAVAEGAASWVAALTRLLGDHKARLSLGRRARAFVAGRYDWRRRGEELAAMIASATACRAGGDGR